MALYLSRAPLENEYFVRGLQDKHAIMSYEHLLNYQLGTRASLQTKIKKSEIKLKPFMFK